MNKYQKQVIKHQLELEKETIDELVKLYEKARTDCYVKIAELSLREDMENIQSIIYQAKYQKAIINQIDSILDVLKESEFKTVNDFLNESFINGWVGTYYELHRVDKIPLIVPIKQEHVIKAIQHDSKLRDPLYNVFGNEIERLKKDVSLEVANGIVQGLSWNEVGKRLSNKIIDPFGKSLNRGIRIARTESHRINEESRYMAQSDAKKKGCDIVRIWDATLDDRTRETHQFLDGQVREFGIPFEVNGKQAMYPGGFGIAEEDINCRCVSLQRAKWALDSETLEIMENRAKYYHLDKTKDFKEFKKNYLNGAEKIIELNSKMSAQEINDKGRLMIGNHWDEYRKKFIKGKCLTFDQTLKNELESEKRWGSSENSFVKLGAYTETNTVERILNTVDTLSQNFYSPLQTLEWMDQQESVLSKAIGSTWHNWETAQASIRFNPVRLKEENLDRIYELGQKKYCVPFPKGKEVEYIVTHEFAHSILTIQDPLPTKKRNFLDTDFKPVKKARKEIQAIYDVKKQELQDPYAEYFLFNKKLKEKGVATKEEIKHYKKLKETVEKIRVSEYGMTCVDEFFAESFTDYIFNGENARPESKEVFKIVLKYFGKVVDE